MVSRVCLAIGVSTVTSVLNQAMRFAYLDGAIFAARSMGEWALRKGFGADNIRVVDDGPTGGIENPVTRERVQVAVNELFPVGAEVVDQLILAFCGHGLTDTNIGSISWLFSDGLAPTNSVSYGLRRFVQLSMTQAPRKNRSAKHRIDVLENVPIGANASQLRHYANRSSWRSLRPAAQQS